MKIIFAGTPHFAATHLQALINDVRHSVVAVYTQPDRPAGRGKKLTSSAVKLVALEHDLPVYQPQSLKAPEAQAVLAELGADIMVVVAYGLILPQAVLDTPRRGCINVHGSILPRWRGAAPIQRAIEAGDAETGVTIMQMDAGLDTGAMLSVARCPILDTDTSGALYDKLAELGAPALLQDLAKLEKGTAVGIAQDNQQSTYASKIDKTEALIDWSQSAVILDRRIRALNPFPAAYSLVDGQRLKVWTATLGPTDHADTPGKIISADANSLVVACGQGSLVLTEIQLAGKSRMPVSEILKSRADLFAVDQQLGA
ncbi:methionyl-tRNA formyltransferase [Porticoccaceae bacterium]|nr:methionyl-tRNA formyltransferase [Porticoccaceae bacterium]MDB9843909.1 methionyl-tRNA formyltransferase [Porticoccaceae bacterium]MDC1477374.1 methionyl-tRNA formyltransferase [Porticoccaceae bacterium]CAI8285189.1 MAG: Methionyl-tRNA formyltransferase [SAR92 bacterium MED-G29]